MNHNSRSRAWFRLAAAYFAVGVMLGVAMGASGDHTLFPVHAHINLLGWVSMALFGLIGTVYPSITEGRVAAAQFWMHNVGVPVMLVALALRIKGFPSAEPLIGVASVRRRRQRAAVRLAGVRAHRRTGWALQRRVGITPAGAAATPARHGRVTR